MQVQTTRFGSIQVSEGDIVTFNEGLLGFSELRRFVLLDDPNDEIFAWLQSCEKPAIAFPILEPELFSDKFGPTITKGDLQAIGLTGKEGMRLFTIITIPEDPTQMTANLKAPIAVNISSRLAKQVVVQENDYQIKFPIFTELQKRVVQNPAAGIRSQALEWGVAVKLPTEGRAPTLDA
jgi:flagellar assembly factor FliW